MCLNKSEDFLMKTAGFVIFTLRSQKSLEILSVYSDPSHSCALRMRPREPAYNIGSSLSLKWVELGTPEAHALPSSMQPPSPLILVSRAQGPDLGANFSYSSSLCYFFLFLSL